MRETGIARAYARRLLAGVGVEAAIRIEDEHPALAWARSGLMALTGFADGPPQMCPAPLAACADGALAALAALAPPGSLDGLRGSQLLAERAAIAGYSRMGEISSGGSCRLLACADDWIAVNLAREDDWALLPAWLEEDVRKEWAGVEAAVKERRAEEWVERGRWLGLAVARGNTGVRAASWFHSSVIPAKAGIQSIRIEPPLDPARKLDSRPPTKALGGRLRGNDESIAARRLRVVDLSALWAGPLCAHLLHLMSAEVIKVESHQRPDGARFGPPAFFDLLNAGKRSVILDPTTASGREALRALLASADIVIESSRPRALRQFGIQAEDLCAHNPALVWIAISGYGRGEPEENWIAYGDDAGVAAGLSQLMFAATGQQIFVGDAIADPLTGLHAALAAWTAWRSGQGGLISLALSEVVRHCLQFDLPESPEALRSRQREWTRLAVGAPVLAPKTRVGRFRSWCPQSPALPAPSSSLPRHRRRAGSARE